jgi:hypothetical protein
MDIFIKYNPVTNKTKRSKGHRPALAEEYFVGVRRK